MAFMINESFLRNSIQVAQPQVKKEESPTQSTKPQITVPSQKAPLGEIYLNTITPSNSAFSSLFLNKEAWLQKEFGVGLNEALGLSKEELDLAYKKADEVQGGKFSGVDYSLQFGDFNSTSVGFSYKA